MSVAVGRKCERQRRRTSSRGRARVVATRDATAHRAPRAAATRPSRRRRARAARQTSPPGRARRRRWLSQSAPDQQNQHRPIDNDDANRQTTRALSARRASPAPSRARRRRSARAGRRPGPSSPARSSCRRRRRARRRSRRRRPSRRYCRRRRRRCSCRRRRWRAGRRRLTPSASTERDATSALLENFSTRRPQRTKRGSQAMAPLAPRSPRNSRRCIIERHLNAARCGLLRGQARSVRPTSANADTTQRAHQTSGDSNVLAMNSVRQRMHGTACAKQTNADTEPSLDRSGRRRHAPFDPRRRRASDSARDLACAEFGRVESVEQRRR